MISFDSRIVVIIAWTMTLSAPLAVAETVYESKGAKGNVTFSDAPTATAVEVDKVRIDPGPPKADVERAEAADRVLDAQMAADEARIKAFDAKRQARADAAVAADAAKSKTEAAAASAQDRENDYIEDGYWPEGGVRREGRHPAVGRPHAHGVR